MRKLPLVLAPLLCLAIAAQSAPAQTGEAGAFATEGAMLVHVESGTRFPDRIAGFERVGQAAFDGSGDYVGVAYKRTLADGTPISLRIAIVHIIGMTAKEHFIIAKPMALNGLADVKVVSEGPYDRPGKGVDGYIGIFRAQQGDKRVGVGLWTVERGYWDVRGRVEFPYAKLKEARAAADRFVEEFVKIGQPYKVPPNAE
ncbi:MULTISPECIES: hypothetical protein [Sphingomonadales]|uniref:DUF1990 domain-containing protein n=2 Tax=Edaphosphingomonas TaxID=3423724 RepID=A0A2T4HYQ3_9SPHN|nr:MULTISPECIES: hypothetical protein [Sphingomonas]MDX3885225.1 hypothetical protein [Sphingomonas sp.]OHT19587.1 hypothetical protein BHE75_01574 [Sphingomonas haloaromaticamans]PTD21212.1 hypothetical protein CV103_10515 [Sphingomonas fennica]